MTTGDAADRSPCAATAQHGGRCGSWALPGSAYCVAHDPARARDQRAARAKGGAAASKLRAIRGQRARLDTPASLAGFLAGLVHRIVEGELTPDVGRVAIYGLATLRQVLETGELEKRLAALEQAVAAKGQTRRIG